MKNYTDVINDINAGTTADALSLILREAASRVLENAKPGEVTLTLKLKPLKGAQNQLSVESITKYKMPTLKGDKAETSADETLMYVSAKGDLTIIPDTAVELPGMAVNQ
ncbi:hypothetical protein ACF3OJ_03110 [Cardiobacterium hominis]|jgi:hypothetical protein|uniref:hypothetical protein n=1 Tax=Cardiobacterium hominis TaxID=2718 RepID=UPI00370DC53B